MRIVDRLMPADILGMDGGERKTAGYGANREPEKE
jgi:hypothetical protein